MISGIVYFRKITLESLRNVSETTPRRHSDEPHNTCELLLLNYLSLLLGTVELQIIYQKNFTCPTSKFMHFFNLLVQYRRYFSEVHLPDWGFYLPWVVGWWHIWSPVWILHVLTSNLLWHSHPPLWVRCIPDPDGSEAEACSTNRLNLKYDWHIIRAHVNFVADSVSWLSAAHWRWGITPRGNQIVGNVHPPPQPAKWNFHLYHLHKSSLLLK